MRKSLLILFVTVGLVSGTVRDTRAQQQPEEISPALAENLRKPLEAFLFATGWSNAGKLVHAAKSWQVLDHIILIRIADPSTCGEDADLCLTIIGSLRSGGFVSEAVFLAGGEIRFPDNPRPLLGKEGPMLFHIGFIGRKQIVNAFPAPTGWIIVPGPVEEARN
jgi:hypothetical protein